MKFSLNWERFWFSPPKSHIFLRELVRYPNFHFYKFPYKYLDIHRPNLLSFRTDRLFDLLPKIPEKSGAKARPIKIAFLSHPLEP